MKTRHSSSRENKKNISGTKRLNKDQKGSSQQVTNSKKNKLSFSMTDLIQETEPLNIQLTFDFQFPPEVPEKIHFPNASNSGI
mgnify:CR=1 FL=1